MSSSPASGSGLMAWSLFPILCLPLSLCPSPVHALSLSVPKINKNVEKKIKKKKRKKKEGLASFWGEECCYFVNQSRIVTTKIKELKERIQCRQQESINQWKGWDLTDWAFWLPDPPLHNFTCIHRPLYNECCGTFY